VEISLAEYNAELTRYQQALGRDLTDEDRHIVLDDLVSQALLAGVAYDEGFTLSDKDLQARIDQLAEKMGGVQALVEWMGANSYTDDQFRQAMARTAAAAWMRDQIIADAPTTAEQVHARQLLFRTEEEASQAYALLQAGSDFEQLARDADPLTGGELGWLARGVLFHPELEEAVFKLQPGEYTPILQTSSGYHIIQVIERDPQRPLDSQARQLFQEKALQDWLEGQRQAVEIEFFV
jgi:parvulin-like peptidyl-prolyl isomerase